MGPSIRIYSNGATNKEIYRYGAINRRQISMGPSIRTNSNAAINKETDSNGVIIK